MSSANNIFFKQMVVQYYQPIVDINSLNIVSYEALLRPLRFGKGPEAFVSQLERTGEILELDLWSLDTAILKSIEQGQGCPPISVNLSGRSICDPMFKDEVNWLLINRPKKARISFEITETFPIKDMFLAKDFVRMLKDNDCKIGLDDYGVGHASLSLFETLDLDYLKLSSRITRLVPDSVKACQLIERITYFARLREIPIVAEHIDNTRQYCWLRETGIEMGQGWLFAKASPVIETQRSYHQAIIDRVKADAQRERDMRFSQTSNVLQLA